MPTNDLVTLYTQSGKVVQLDLSACTSDGAVLRLPASADTIATEGSGMQLKDQQGNALGLQLINGQYVIPIYSPGTEKLLSAILETQQAILKALTERK